MSNICGKKVLFTIIGLTGSIVFLYPFFIKFYEIWILSKEIPLYSILLPIVKPLSLYLLYGIFVVGWFLFLYKSVIWK